MISNSKQKNLVHQPYPAAPQHVWEFRLAYLHLTLAHSKGQVQVYFDCEFLIIDFIYIYIYIYIYIANITIIFKWEIIFELLSTDVYF